MGVFVSEVSSPFVRIRVLIADRPIQAPDIALESLERRIRLHVDDENAPHRALDALGIVSEAGPVYQHMLMEAVSEAALDDLAVSKEIRRDSDHERSKNPAGMW